MAASGPDDRDLLATRIRVPAHVVYREFADETVILNLESGQYHGLNATAAKMLEVLESASSVDEAVDRLAEAFAQPREVVEPDVLTLCRALSDRGLIANHASDTA
jgi:hypothetical protein